jgi:membrane protease YdiL (CAAX protease family)
MVITELRFTLPIVALIAGYTWVLAPRTPHWVSPLVTLMVLGLSMWRAGRTGEWGLRRSALWPALRHAAAFTVPAVVVLCVVGSMLGPRPRRANPWGDLAFLVPWAAGQQFALQTVLLRETQAATSRRQGILLAAAVFGALHLPNPFLAPVTLVAALAWCWIYDRHPNLLPLALSHALCTLAILYCFDPKITGGLRIGYAYLQRH